MKKQINNQHSSAATELSWTEERVPLSQVIKHHPLQARKKLDIKAVARYANMTKEGSKPPPIKVARVEGALYLLDGWHRIEAGALQLSNDYMQGTVVLALVASMPFERMFWEAARANVGNGVQYKTSEYRPVFSAFIKSKQHHKGRREYMSYREIAAALGLGVSYSTLRRWTKMDFPSLFAAIGGDENRSKGGAQPIYMMTPEEQHTTEAHKAAGALDQHAGAVSDPVSRWDILQRLEKTAAMLRAKGVEMPQF